MVGRLVQKQNIHIFGQHFRQRHLSPLSAGKVCHLCRIVQNSKLRQIALHLPVRIRISVQCISGNIRIRAKHRILQKIGSLFPILPDNLSFIRLLLSGNHLQKGGFSGTVNSDNPYFVSFLYPKRGIFKKKLIAKSFCNVFYIYDIHLFAAPVFFDFILSVSDHTTRYDKGFFHLRQCTEKDCC